jgi:hypothetical protein
MGSAVSGSNPTEKMDYRRIISGITESEESQLSNRRIDEAIGEVNDVTIMEADVLPKRRALHSVEISSAYRAFGSRTCRVRI